MYVFFIEKIIDYVHLDIQFKWVKPKILTFCVVDKKKHVILSLSMMKPRHWDQMVNELLLEQIIRENPSSIPGGNNSWPDFTYHTAKLWMTEGFLPLGTRGLIPKKRFEYDDNLFKILDFNVVFIGR
jgi:hypothetical protein